MAERLDGSRAEHWRPVVVVAVLIVVAAVLGFAVHGRPYPTDLDSWFYATFVRELHYGPIARELLRLVTEPVLVGATLIVFAALCARRKRHRLVALAVLAPSVSTVLNSLVLKPLVSRTYHDYLSYPSGHTVLLISALTTVVIGYHRFAIPALLIAIVGMYGLVVDRYHYLTDTLGGATLACALTIIAWLLLRGRPGTARPTGTAPADISSDNPRPASPW